MDKLREFLLPRAEPGAETLLDRAVREELRRRDLMRAVCSSHRTAGTAPIPAEQQPKRVH